MSQKMYNYIRSHRKCAGLSQEELAFLLGCQFGTKVSRYENYSREPNIYTAFACQAVFRIEASMLFPGMYAEVEHAVITRARMLQKILRESGGSSTAPHKLIFLDALIAKEHPCTRTIQWKKQ